MIHKKKGYISIEYIIVAGMVLVTCGFIFVQNFSSYTDQINTRTKNALDILSSDEIIE